MRRRLFALMAGAQKYAASVDWQRQNCQPVPGGDQSADAQTKNLDFALDELEAEIKKLAK